MFASKQWFQIVAETVRFYATVVCSKMISKTFNFIIRLIIKLTHGAPCWICLKRVNLAGTHPFNLLLVNQLSEIISSISFLLNCELVE